MPRKYSNSVKIKYPPSEKNQINLLEENISKIVNEVKIIEEIILFGSYARRDPHYGSDVDLLFVLSKRTKNDFDVIYENLFDISLEYEWSPILLTVDQLRKFKQENSPFIQTVMNEGIKLCP